MSRLYPKGLALLWRVVAEAGGFPEQARGSGWAQGEVSCLGSRGLALAQLALGVCQFSPLIACLGVFMGQLHCRA
jgi:hypothetical protein